MPCFNPIPVEIFYGFASKSKRSNQQVEPKKDLPQPDDSKVTKSFEDDVEFAKSEKEDLAMESPSLDDSKPNIIWECESSDAEEDMPLDDEDSYDETSNDEVSNDEESDVEDSDDEDSDDEERLMLDDAEDTTTLDCEFQDDDEDMFGLGSMRNDIFNSEINIEKCLSQAKVIGDGIPVKELLDRETERSVTLWKRRECFPIIPDYSSLLCKFQGKNLEDTSTLLDVCRQVILSPAMQILVIRFIRHKEQFDNEDLSLFFGYLKRHMLHC